jgi:hypothetical protein
MKKEINLLVLLCLMSGSLFAQFGQITAIQMIPTNPTDADQIKAVAEVMLGSSPCNLDNASSSVNGNTIQLNTYYCEGLLATICSRTDTIVIGTLAAGSYNLVNLMATGCGPYISVDSSLNNNFSVSVFSGVTSNGNKQAFNIYPNPVSNTVNIDLNKIFNACEVTLISSKGNIVLSQNAGAEKIIKLNVAQISNGNYTLQLIDNKGNILQSEKLIIQHN